MTGSEIIINGPDGSFGGYLSVPSANHGPGIVVIQEIFGINKVMRDIADGLAARGYFALAPDLFWRIEPNVQLTDKSDAEWQRAFSFMTRFNIDSGVTDVQATIAHLRALPGATGKVGAVGYCLGGLLAYLTATRTDADACVGYYGVNIDQKLDETKNIRKPLMLHMAEKDEYVKPEAQKKIADALQGLPLVALYAYPEMSHAFAREGGAHYDKACAALANGRTSTFFKQYLS